jgi:hypothetical protein
MSLYDQAASKVLDLLWEEEDFRSYFHSLGADLSDLGPLTVEVFVPAYLKVKKGLDAQSLELLEADVTQDLLEPFYDRPGFRQVWAEWDQETRDEFIREQSEVRVATLLIQIYADQFAEAYKASFETYHARQRK